MIELEKRKVLVVFTVTALLLVAGVGALWATLSPSTKGRADPTNERQVALGERLYRDDCASCHGVNLEGQPNWKVRNSEGRLPAPPHDDTGHTWHHPDEVLFRITKQGVSAMVPNYESDMPAYADILTDAEIWAVLAYIKSRWPEPIQNRQANINRRSE